MNDNHSAGNSPTGGHEPCKRGVEVGLNQTVTVGANVAVVWTRPQSLSKYEGEGVSADIGKEGEAARED